MGYIVTYETAEQNEGDYQIQQILLGIISKSVKKSFWF